MKSLIIKAISTLFSVIVLSEIWWNLVMYKGFPINPPEFVRMLVVCGLCPELFAYLVEEVALKLVNSRSR